MPKVFHVERVDTPERAARRAELTPDTETVEGRWALVWYLTKQAMLMKGEADGAEPRLQRSVVHIHRRRR